MANTFNGFFANIGPQLDKEIPLFKRPGGCKIYLNPRIPISFLASPTNPQEISDIINTLDDSKSSGPCSVPIKMLKVDKHLLSIPFSDICNTSFIEGKNKVAKVIPSHKKGCTDDVNNYRHISLLSVF